LVGFKKVEGGLIPGIEGFGNNSISQFITRILKPNLGVGKRNWQFGGTGFYGKNV